MIDNGDVTTTMGAGVFLMVRFERHEEPRRIGMGSDHMVTR
jgi:hypothetical protein